MTGWLHPYDEGYPHEELTMTETQDGERITIPDPEPDTMVTVPHYGEVATPTPDDRDREVERIAAVLDAIDWPGKKLVVFNARKVAAAIVAGLRASGGTEG